MNAAEINPQPVCQTCWLPHLEGKCDLGMQLREELVEITERSKRSTRDLMTSHGLTSANRGRGSYRGVS